GSLNYWSDRLKEQSISVENISRFDEQGLRFTDPDGLLIELIASDSPSPGALRPPLPEGEDKGEGNLYVIREFHAPTLQVQDSALTQKLLTETLGFQQIAEQGSRRRFSLNDPHVPPSRRYGAAGNPLNAPPGRDPGTDAQRQVREKNLSLSAQVDLVERPDDPHGHIAAGTVHHIAFRTPSDEEQLEWREKLVDLGFAVSPVMDREYFHSIYFREPNGILFEIATDGPGFTIDEPAESLGESLKLPKQFEAHRSALEQALPPISLK
ncbi:MAG: glyoxalase family protein, partial [Verrucomicrobiota bacterium]